MSDEEIEAQLEAAKSEHPIYGTVYDMWAIAAMNAKGIYFKLTKDGITYSRKRL